MWQDVLVSVVALGAVIVLGRKWIRPKAAATPNCPSCAAGDPANDKP
jgi:hypothetical protein